MNGPRSIIIVLSCILSSLYSVAQPFRIPAEWEPQEKVWLTWFGQERRDSVTCRVIEALQPSVKIALNITADSICVIASKYMSGYRIDISRIEFVTDANVDFFTRDYVLFVKTNDEKLKVVCFDYSAYGIYPQVMNEPLPEEEIPFGKWDERLAKQLNLPMINSNYVFEGGGIEANGKGTLMIIKDMALQRNPGKSLPGIEKELTRTLGARKIIWLEKGLVEDKHYPGFGPFYKNYFGGGANMHIDELCRFVNEYTVILPFISKDDRRRSPIDSINGPMLDKNLEILNNARTADGKKLAILRVPMPEAEQLTFSLTVKESDQDLKRNGFNTGDTIYRVPAASYCNFFISNKVVLIPKYWKPGMTDTQRKKDEEVRQLFVKLFPGKKIMQIFALSVNRGGGGIHCMTRELPLYLK